MLWSGQRVIKQIAGQGKRDRALLRLHRAGPADAYADLLAYALSKNWSAGWAYYAFLEIFGAEPWEAGLQRRNIKPKESPSDAVTEWATTCKRKPAAKRRPV